MMYNNDVNKLKEKYLGKTIEILDMSGEPQYTGRTGKVTSVDDIGQLHGEWGGLALMPGEDKFEIIYDGKEGE